MLEKTSSSFLYCLVVVVVVVVIFAPSVRPQEVFSFENCDLINCPLDCRLNFPDGEECPVCDCPLGQRCPLLNCPSEPSCLKVQRLDGCLSCACAGTTYEALDTNRNTMMFATNPNDLPVTIVREACNLYDTQTVRRCVKDVLDYMRSLENSNADLLARPMVSMFLYSRTELLEVCGKLQRVAECVGDGVRQRCARQERHMQMMSDMFGMICRRSADESFLDDYDCLHNILSSHVDADRCSRQMAGSFDKTVKSLADDGAKRRGKCQGLNDYMACVRPTLKLFCPQSAIDLFRVGMLRASGTIAPECLAATDRFEAVQSATFQRVRRRR